MVLEEGGAVEEDEGAVVLPAEATAAGGSY